MSRQTLTRLALLTLLTGGLLDLGSNALADQARRSMRKSQPASPSHAAPDITSTIPATTSAAAKDDETLPKPFDLPVAPRARMRSCGEKWQSIKMSGGGADQTWRDFATKCLAQADDVRKPTP